jgi:heptosyltransferase-2
LNGSVPPQTLAVTPAEEEWCRAALQQGGVGAHDLVLGINPGATFGSAKRWYPDRFAAVAEELASRWGMKVVITGGREEAALAAEIEQAMSLPALNFVGQTNVRQLLALIKRCNFFITNDSGPMHIAAAFQVPLVAIFGSTDHTTTYPLATRTVVVRQTTDCAPCLKRECPTDHRCMSAITAAMVVEAAEKLKEQL